MTKKMVPVEVSGYLDFEETLDRLLVQLADLRATHGPTAYIRMEYEAYSNSESKYPHLYVMREETDEQYAARLLSEETYARAQEIRERATLEALQKKYVKA